ncbi:unnamed protein product [Cyprideis torosa]|uniref:Kinase n=1 Tax=Cyprideis torosa TaxID=163714 RepID=A0A7R8W4M3_9CRUS|nr:unnamed protein product [Cyprideis torosa]CAG0884342.1 unnamed protein product [Cyprideis torosa]
MTGESSDEGDAICESKGGESTLDYVESALTDLIKGDDLLNDVHPEATEEELKTLTQLAKGQALKLYLDREDGLTLEVVIAEDANYRALQNAVQLSIKRKLNRRAGEKYFILEDLTHGYALPCVMDIKIGKQTHEPNARPEKALAENKKYLSTKPIVGFCLPGAKFYSINAADWIYFDKHTGNSLQPGDLGPAILTFLNESKVLCGMVISCLKELLDWFETKNSHFAFFATSILLTYDASCLKEDDAMHPPSVLVKMIDFAHTLPVSEEVKCLLRETSHLDMAGDPETNVNFRDENYIFGLKNLIRCLEEVISR